LHTILEEQKGQDKKNKKKEKPKEAKEEKHIEENKEEKPEEKPKEKKEKKNKKKEEKKEGEEPKKEEKKKHEQKKAMEPKEIFKLCDLRVGYVEECTILEGFNDIYSLIVDLGEENKRQIGTGLRNHVPIDKIKNTKIVVFSNLKPKKFGKDFESNGMILTSSLKDGENKIYELIRPDEKAKPGEKVYLDGTELDPKKEATISPKRFGQILDNLKTNDECFCLYDGTKLRTESGFVTAPLKNAPIS
jgi:aminoacyl tRNA synthase complex-interacting multifunctional protein 1